MANYYEATNIKPQKFVTYTSRYSENTVVYYKEEKYLTFNTYKKNTYPPSSRDRYTVITKGYEYRPDLLSQKVYGFPDYWWKIMEANNIKDIYDFKAGVNIKIPESVT
jgi:hypothetical protein